MTPQSLDALARELRKAWHNYFGAILPQGDTPPEWFDVARLVRQKLITASREAYAAAMTRCNWGYSTVRAEEARLAYPDPTDAPARRIEPLDVDEPDERTLRRKLNELIAAHNAALTGEKR